MCRHAWVRRWQCVHAAQASQRGESAGGALSWGSRKQKPIALSSCEAEIIALSEAAKDVVYLRKLVSGLDAAEPSPTCLGTDSQSARDVSYNPEHHNRMKHVECRHFFVRDMVEKFEIEVPFVRTDDNLADFFTKLHEVCLAVPRVPQARHEPVSYTHLTLPTILLV